jgi:isohexenylglutaconyl-CoA hydratase
VILRGAGGNFSAGGDLNAMKSMPPAPGPGEVDPLYARYRQFGDVLQTLDTLPQAVIAVLEGAAVGGGLGLACCADVVIVHARAKLGIPEPRAGFIPSQMIPYLVRRIGPNRARSLAITSNRIDGREAHRIGLADHCCEDSAMLEAILAETIAAILHCAPGAIATVKHLIAETQDQPLQTVLDAAGAALVERLRSPDAAEGMAAFLEKRPPRWVP